jgi:hypothetical protein
MIGEPGVPLSRACNQRGDDSRVKPADYRRSRGVVGSRHSWMPRVAQS